MKANVLKENMLAFWVAAILSVVVFFLINNLDFLKADINAVNNGAQNEINSDIVYAQDQWKFTITSNIDTQRVLTLSYVLVFDPQQVTIPVADIDTKDLQYTVSDSGSWRLTVMLLDVQNLKKWQILTQLPFQWDIENITIADAFVKFTDETVDKLSIASK